MPSYGGVGTNIELHILRRLDLQFCGEATIGTGSRIVELEWFVCVGGHGCSYDGSTMVVDDNAVDLGVLDVRDGEHDVIAGMAIEIDNEMREGGRVEKVPPCGETVEMNVPLASVSTVSLLFWSLSYETLAGNTGAPEVVRTKPLTRAPR
jgi:hypothetical protein